MAENDCVCSKLVGCHPSEIEGYLIILDRILKCKMIQICLLKHFNRLISTRSICIFSLIIYRTIGVPMVGEK